MKTIDYSIRRDLTVTHDADVLVLGGGPGGLGAAVMAARAGAKTVLVERYGYLGGMAAAGEVHPFMRNHVDNEPLDGPIYTEWCDRMRALWPRDGADTGISKDVAMLAAEQMCLDAGVEVLYHHMLADAIVTDGHIDAAVLLSKSGLSAAAGAMFIDATGDGDLAVRAGCAYEQGGPTGHCQPMTTCFKVCNVDRDRMPDRAGVTELYHAARERGEIDCLRENVLMFNWFEDDVVHFNTTRIIHRDGTNGLDLSAAEREGHTQVRQFLAFFRAHVPGFENAQLHSMAHHVGIRETRRILGEAYLQQEAFENHAKFPDAIARVRYNIDIHNPDGAGTELIRLPEGEWYEIPFGCVVARDADNLLIAGRPISVDHAIHSSMRVMPPACTVGQAAGMGAAMAARRGCRPKDLDGTAVRRALIEQGAKLAEA
ncbi:MAG: FAD-dependent oxidoreductase [Planctomycetota bacterium]